MALRDAGYRGHITAGRPLRHLRVPRAPARLPRARLASAARRRRRRWSSWRARSRRARRSATIAGLALRDDDGASSLTEQPALPDLATLPWPDRRGEPAACFGHAIAPLVGSRGCYANCTFCCIAAWHEQSQPGQALSPARAVGDVADEMVALQRDARHRRLRLPRRQLLRPRPQEERRALQRAGRRARGARHRPLRDRGQGAPDRRATRGVPRPHATACTASASTSASRPTPTRASRRCGRWSQPQQNHRAIELVRELDLYTCFNMLHLRSRHHAREPRDQHRLHPRRRRVPLQLRPRRALCRHAAARAHAARGALLGRLHAVGLRARRSPRSSASSRWRCGASTRATSATARWPTASWARASTSRSRATSTRGSFSPDVARRGQGALPRARARQRRRPDRDRRARQTWRRRGGRRSALSPISAGGCAPRSVASGPVRGRWPPR